MPAVEMSTVTVVRREAHSGGATEKSDSVATEEPLEVRIVRPGSPPHPVAVVMRTPGADFELATGLVLTERIVPRASDIESAHWGAPADFNAVELVLAPGVEPAGIEDRRAWFSASSCGLCGKESISQVATASEPVTDDVRVSTEVVCAVPESLRARQTVFDATGGLHAAGAFTAGGDAIAVYEDIGRHNAVDKVVGHLARAGALPAAASVLAVSGRVSFEIVQKASIARFPVIVAVSAPSSLAVDLARALGMTLCAFVRGDSFGIYAGAERIR